MPHGGRSVSALPSFSNSYRQNGFGFTRPLIWFNYYHTSLLWSFTRLDICDLHHVRPEGYACEARA
jgi:hypothetical protein